MNYYGSEYIEQKVFDYINWAYSCNGICTLSSLRDRFKAINVLEVCERLRTQGKVKFGLGEDLDLTFSIPAFSRETCEHRIPTNWSKHSHEKVTSRNCLRIETFAMSDRCSLKMPEHWTDVMKERAHIDILNGYIFDFGFCNGKCPGCV